MNAKVASFYAAVLTVVVSYIITRDINLLKWLAIIVVPVAVGRFVWLDEVLYEQRTRG